MSFRDFSRFFETFSVVFIGLLLCLVQEDGREEEEDPARALYHSEVAISMPFGSYHNICISIS